MNTGKLVDNPERHELEAEFISGIKNIFYVLKLYHLRPNEVFEVTLHFQCGSWDKEICMQINKKAATKLLCNCFCFNRWAQLGLNQ